MTTMKRYLTIDLLDLLEYSEYDIKAMQYILMVELKSSGFPIDFDYTNPHNPKPSLVRGIIKTESTDNIKLEYKFDE